MAQVKVYGLKENLSARRRALSDAIQESLVDAFELPEEKRFQRFIALDREDVFFPPDRTQAYTIIEISIFEGRSREAKRKLIHGLFSRVGEQAGISSQDLEITIFETPRENWGIRGQPGDQLALSYPVKV